MVRLPVRTNRRLSLGHLPQMKVELELVGEILAEHDSIHPEERQKIVRDIQRAAEQLLAEKEQKENIAKQFVILVRRPEWDGQSEPRDDEMVPDIGWVVQLPENDSPALAYDRIVDAAHDQNATRRGRKHPVKSFGEACEAVGAKFLKQRGVWVKTKLPVQVVVVDSNDLPKRVEAA